MGRITPKGFARPIEIYRLDGLKAGVEADLGSEERSMVHIGKHVEVSIPNMSNIREAIIELKLIQEDFEEKANSVTQGPAQSSPEPGES